MKERILLLSGVNGSELMRSLARFGVNSLGVRMMGGMQLAQLALTRSGLAVTAPPLTSREAPAFIYSFLQTVPYFSAASYADAEQLASAMNTLRRFIPADEANSLKEGLKKGEFPEKNQALISIYEKYMAALKAAGKTDAVCLMRRAIEESAPFGENTELLTVRDLPISPLERRLLQHVSAGSFREISLTELFGKNAAAPIRGLSFAEAYGAVNEAEHILDDILRQQFPLDACTVACSSDRYNRLFFDLCGRYGLLATFGNGVPILSTNPGKLLKLIYDWHTRGYHGIDAFGKIIGSDALDQAALRELTGMEAKDTEAFVKLCGSLRLSFDAPENVKRLRDCQAALQEKLTDFRGGGAKRERRELESMIKACGYAGQFSVLLAEGIVPLMRRLTYIRKQPAEAGAQDRAALSVITESLGAYLLNVGGAPEDIIPDILSKTVGSESSRPGYLHITTIPGACAALREHLYICGLSADEFPGSPKENYLLQDSDWSAFASPDIPPETIPTSAARIEEKKKQLRLLLELACTLGIRPQLSYIGYNTATLKEQNPSSVLLELFAEETGGSAKDFRASLHRVSYFDASLSDSGKAAKAHAAGKKLCVQQPEPYQPQLDAETLQKALGKMWSPSALETFFNCPRHFYFKEILGLPEEETDDPFMVLSPAATGTLAHALMERLGAERLSKPEFLKEAEKCFDREMRLRPPISENEAKREKQAFLDMMGRAFDMEPACVQIVSAENEYKGTHPSGISLHGYPDRIEQLPDGTCVIADYKTGRMLKHLQNDPDSCLQVILYAWLAETSGGLTVSHTEYRYLRLGETVHCEYGAGIRDALTQKLTAFKEALEQAHFERNPGKRNENCRYCRFEKICGRDRSAEKEAASHDE